MIVLKIPVLLFIFAISTFSIAEELDGQTSWSEEYYVDQALKYFDTLDTYADSDSKPTYGKTVIRWEWFPWLKLTGYKRFAMKLDFFLKWYPTEVIDRDCRAFSEPPQARCRVTFHYKKSKAIVPIYEEFTFNDFGEMTFIEAWSNEPHLLPMDPDKDFWGEGEDMYRLSTKVPGLNDTATGEVRTKDKEFKRLAREDSDLYQLRKKMRRPVWNWVGELFRWGLIKDQGGRRLMMNWVRERRSFAKRFRKEEYPCWKQLRRDVKKRRYENHLSLHELGKLSSCENIVAAMERINEQNESCCY